MAVDLLAQRADRARRSRRSRSSRLRESHGPAGASTSPGSASRAPACSGSSGASSAANESAGERRRSSASLVGGASLLVARSSLWELRRPRPMLPMRFFRNRDVRARERRVAVHVLRDVRLDLPARAVLPDGAGLLAAPGSGLRILPWTAMPIFIAPIAGALSDRIGGQRIMGVGLTLQAIGLGWIAAVSTPTVPYSDSDRAVLHLGHRDGALLRAGRERRAQRGPAGRGGAGVGRRERDPRARRRVRRGRARIDLRALRRLPLGQDFVDGMRRRSGSARRSSASAPWRRSSSRLRARRQDEVPETALDRPPRKDGDRAPESPAPRSSLRSAERQPGVLHARGLAGRELRVALVVRVVHVVVDRVGARRGARVLPSGQPEVGVAS